MKIDTPRQIRIDSYHMARQIAHMYDYVVSIGEPGMTNHVKAAKKTLVLQFDDVTSEFHSTLITPVPPSMDHVQQIKAFAEEFVADPNAYSILLHCAAGISRSAAAAVVVLMVNGHTLSEAQDIVQRIRPMSHPNALMVKHAKEIFGLNKLVGM